MINTDGFEMSIPRDYQEKYNKICASWEKLTDLILEFDDYKKMIINDVNNYMAIDSNDKIKLKGAYDHNNEELGLKVPLHKNKSYDIIAKAVFNYFYYDIPVDKTIENANSIYDFCAGVKRGSGGKKGVGYFELHHVTPTGLKIESLADEKVIRYFISNKGPYLLKHYADNSYAHVEAPKKVNKAYKKEWRVTYFNEAGDSENHKDYDIDYSYYKSKAREWINSLEGLQPTLF